MPALEPTTPDEPSRIPGARAARLLAESCRSGSARESPLRLELVRSLALVIELELDAAAHSVARAENPDLLIEAALRCADLATLAACNAGPAIPDAGTVVRQAGDAARRLLSAARPGIERLQSEHAEYLLKDARGVEWRVDLAARQVGESPRGEV
jgi:hypothetical protein